MKKVLCVLIAILIAMSGLTVSFAEETEAAVFNADTLIEAEDGVCHITGSEILVKSDDANASGSYLRTNLGGNRDVPAGEGDELYGDYTYDINIPSDGTYYVYLRYRNDNTYWQGTYVTIDNEAYTYYSAWNKGYTDWTWIQTKSTALTAGTHTVKITARKTGNYIDMIYVTKKTAFNGLNSVNTVIEAESGAYHSSGNEIIVKSDDANASGGSYLKTNLAANRDVPAGEGDELYADYTYDINIPADGKYYIYLRYKNSNAYWQGTYVTFDNIAYSYYSGWQKGYTDWTWIQTNSAELTAGAHTVKITARKGGNDIDAIYVTKNDKFNGFFETETLIEAEAGAYHSTGSEFVVKSDDENASGGSYLFSNLGITRDVPAGDGYELYADYTYDVNIPADGTYYVFLKYKNANYYWQGTHVTIDNNSYANYCGWQKIYSDWTWISTASASLKAGAHTVKITARKAYNYIDAICVTSDANFKGFITPETVVVEAEHTQFTPAKDGKLLYINGGGSADYSNGYYIANAGSWDTEDRTGFTPETAADVLYNVTVKEAGDYDLWFRSKEGASVSAHIEANGNNYPASYVSLPATTEYAWKKVKTLSLNAGDNKIGMIFRNPGMNIDMIAVTSDASFDGSSVEFAPIAAPLNNNTGLIQAESLVSSGILDDAGALGGKTVEASSLSVKFTSQKAFGETAKLWIRYKGTPAGVQATMDGVAVDASAITASAKYVWKKIELPVKPVKNTTVEITGFEGAKVDACIVYQWSTDPNGVSDYNPVEAEPETVVFEAEHTDYRPVKENKVCYIMADTTLSNGYYIATASPYDTGVDYQESTPETAYDVRYDVNVKAEGNYDVWVKFKQTINETLSVHIAANNNKYPDAYGVNFEKTTEWKWVKVKTLALNEGANKIGMIFRKPGINIDMIAVTNDSSFDGSAVENAPALATLESNQKLIQAEDLVTEGIIEEKGALNGKVVKTSAVSFDFVSEKSFNRTAKIWLRYKGNPEGIKITADGVEADVSALTASDGYTWKIATVSVLPVKNVQVSVTGIDNINLDAVMVYYFSDQNPTTSPWLTTVVSNTSFETTEGSAYLVDTAAGKKLVEKYAIISGKFINEEGPAVSEYGVVLSATEDFADAKTFKANENKDGSFGVLFWGNGLTNKVYYAKAYAKCVNAEGEGHFVYGDVIEIDVK